MSIGNRGAPLKACLLILCLASLVAEAGAPVPEPASAVPPDGEVLATDAAFAAMSADRGEYRAFEEYLAADAVVFHPEPVLARDWRANHEQGAGRLDWTPVASAVDCGAQWAVTTGPWKYTGRDGGAPAEGHYLSVWRREADGNWRVVLDNGIGHGPAMDDGASLRAALGRLWPESLAKTCGAGKGAAELQDAESDLNEAMRSDGMQKALSRVAAPDAIAYRDDFEPRLLANAGAADGIFGRGTEATTHFAMAAPGSDMGYSYGIVAGSAPSASPTARAVYIRIWRWDGRRWRVAIDMLTPIQPAGQP